jgi:hypothetical protein
MVCSETDFKYPLAYARGSVFLPDHVTVAKYQKLCGIGLKPAATGSGIRGCERLRHDLIHSGRGL